VRQHSVQRFGPWRAAQPASEAISFSAYLKSSVVLVFTKLMAETSWYMIVKEDVQAVMMCIMLVPLLGAACTWDSWRRSSRWLRTAWVLAFARPFVTCAVPTRLLIDFEGVIAGDMEIITNETRAHFDLDSKLESALGGAHLVCQANPLGRIHSAMDAAGRVGGEARAKLSDLCKLTQALDDSWAVEWMTPFGDAAHAANLKCQDAREQLRRAADQAMESHEERQRAVARAKGEVDELCGQVRAMSDAMREHAGSPDPERRELQELARFAIRDGLAGLSEGLDMAVGFTTGIASFKSLWPAALSLGPGIVKGAMRAKTIVPEASLPGAFVIVLPWIYAPLTWALFNVVVQLFGDVYLLSAMALFAFYPLLISLVSLCFYINSPQRSDHLEELITIARRVEVVAVTLTVILLGTFIYSSYRRVEEAKQEHPVLRGLMKLLLKHSLEFKDFLHERYENADLVHWIQQNPEKTLRMALGGLEPVFSFVQKYVLTSVVSTDWILSRVAYEHRFEHLLTNQECLPYHASQADVEELSDGRERRLNALVVAFGGRYQEASARRKQSLLKLSTVR